MLITSSIRLLLLLVLLVHLDGPLDSLLVPKHLLDEHLGRLLRVVPLSQCGGGVLGLLQNDPLSLERSSHLSQLPLVFIILLDFFLEHLGYALVC